jgi:hypothetical protein
MLLRGRTRQNRDLREKLCKFSKTEIESKILEEGVVRYNRKDKKIKGKRNSVVLSTISLMTMILMVGYDCCELEKAECVAKRMSHSNVLLQECN